MQKGNFAQEESHRLAAEKEGDLDPDDWQALTKALHRTSDEIVAKLRSVADDPVWEPIPETSKQAISISLPERGRGIGPVLDDLHDHVLQYPLGNIHPRHWGWVNGTGTAEGLLAALVEAGMNGNLWGCEQAGVYVDLQVVEWLRQIMEFPDTAGGTLVTGTSMGNFLALYVALTAKAPKDYQIYGLQHPDNQKLAVYTSTEAHASLRKAMRVLGLGENALRPVPVRDDFSLDPVALTEAIGADRAEGLRPFCVFATAGTVGTGAIDPISDLRGICDREDLWLHVDGAFGAAAILSKSHRDRVAAISTADSLAFDLHKWFYQQYAAGCLLVRDKARMKCAFSTPSPYLVRMDGGLSAGPVNQSDYSLELSRNCRGLGFWISMQVHGRRKFAEMIQKNIDQARYLTALVEQNAELELLAPTALNVVNFRYVPSKAGHDPDEVNKAVVQQLQAKGLAAPSHTMVSGRFSIRVALVNHRSRRRDIEFLVEHVCNVGREYAA